MDTGLDNTEVHTGRERDRGARVAGQHHCRCKGRVSEGSVCAAHTHLDGLWHRASLANPH